MALSHIPLHTVIGALEQVCQPILRDLQHQLVVRAWQSVWVSPCAQEDWLGHLHGDLAGALIVQTLAPAAPS